MHENTKSKQIIHLKVRSVVGKIELVRKIGRMKVKCHPCASPLLDAVGSDISHTRQSRYGST